MSWIHCRATRVMRVMGAVTVLAGLAGCVGEKEGAPPNENAGSAQKPALATSAPSTLSMDPNGTTPLAGVVSAATNRPARATLNVRSQSENWDVEFPEYATDHYLPVLGLKPGTAYNVSLEFEDEDGDRLQTRPTLLATTPPLPADFPQILVSVSRPAKMEPGYTLLDRFAGGSGQAYQIIVDAHGEVVWYSTGGGRATLQLPNGNLRWRGGSDVIERDMLGNEVPRVTLAASELHHDLVRTEHGTYLSLSREIRRLDDYPSSEKDPAAPTQTADIEADVAVEFALDGGLLDSWPLADIIDPTRIGYGSLAADANGVFDWSHSNAIVHDPGDDSLIVSVRHQDAVIKFSRATGRLVWILGPHDNWSAAFQPFLLTPVGPLSWQYHQHAPMFTPSGNLLLFDNGNFRASPFDGRPKESGPSRAVEYAIDEARMEVRQVWEYGVPPADGIFAGSLSDADCMPQTGNVLMDFGSASIVNGVASEDLGLGTNHARIIEVDRGTPAEVVFDMSVYEPTGRLTVYRVERIPSLYPTE